MGCVLGLQQTVMTEMCIPHSRTKESLYTILKERCRYIGVNNLGQTSFKTHTHTLLPGGGSARL